MIRLKTKEFRPPAAAPTAPPVPAAAPPPAVSVPPAGETAWRVLPLEGAFEFSYLDAAGQPSLRRVTALELKVGPGKLLLGGIDGQLNAYRGFRVDRIHRLEALDSQEVVSRNILDWLLERALRQERARARAAAPQAARAAQATAS